MIDYSITITDDDGDSVTLSHDFDAPSLLMLEATGLIVSDEFTTPKTVMVTLNMAHIRAIHRFLDMAYGNYLLNGTEEAANDD
jgi:Ni,Fe-hydrogenase I cytochrome b subunit